MNYLTFRLYGPMVSWGEIAVGEARHTARYPGKSAICGLLAAALGIERTEESQHQSLTEGYLQAIKMETTGHLLKDYHTAQAPDSSGKFRYRTRRDELVHGRDRLGTILSSREYRTDSQAIVALCEQEGAPYTLGALQQALLSPIFQLYLGRKSCPLAAPLDPQLIDAENFKAAFDGYHLKPLLVDEPEWSNDKRWLKPDALTHYYWEGTPDEFMPFHENDLSARQLQKLTRYDKPLSRQRWQFQPRTEYLWLDQRKDTH